MFKDTLVEHNLAHRDNGNTIKQETLKFSGAYDILKDKKYKLIISKSTVLINILVF